ncbi:MAG TPA: TolC family protein [Kofleriaceae bacterium]|nr:TolC family protein [Kofleriaceae bacterium]
MRLSVLAVVAAATSAAHAEPGRQPITLEDALAAARDAPAARVSPHEVEAAEASIGAASAWPAPSIHLATDRLTARLVAGASIPLPVFGTVGAARRQATAEAEVVRAEAELVRRELRHRVVVAWVALARADGEVTTTSIAAQQAAELELIARGRLAAGTGADVDVTVASAARARAGLAAAAAERDEDAASAELAGLLGWDPARMLIAAGAPVTGGEQELGTLIGRLGVHPERAAAERRVDAAQAAVDQALSQRWPMIAVEGEVSLDDPTLEPQGKNDARVGLSLELPVFSHVGDKARAARATREADRARLVATEHTLAGELVAAYRRWQAATDALHALERDVEPAQERAAALSAQAFREGARDLESALQAERDLAQVRAELNNARADAAIAFADLELAAGQEIDGAP